MRRHLAAGIFELHRRRLVSAGDPAEAAVHERNGRHARLAADLLIVQLGGIRFSWGSANFVQPQEIRRTYVRALQAADRHDMDALVAFARS